MTHAEMNDAALNAVREIGKTYAKLIFQKAIMFDFELHQMEGAVDDAVSDTRSFVERGGICDHDVEITCYTLRLAIIEEGRRLASLLPESQAVMQ